MLSHLNIGKKRTWITYHIEAERKPTGDTVGRTPDNEEKMWKIKRKKFIDRVSV